jgi:hypothetical protein
MIYLLHKICILLEEENEKRSLYYSRQNIFFSSSNSNNDILLLEGVIKKTQHQQKEKEKNYISTCILFLSLHICQSVSCPCVSSLSNNAKKTFSFLSNKEEKDINQSKFRVFFLVLNLYIFLKYSTNKQHLDIIK